MPSERCWHCRHAKLTPLYTSRRAVYQRNVKKYKSNSIIAKCIQFSVLSAHDKSLATASNLPQFRQTCCKKRRPVLRNGFGDRYEIRYRLIRRQIFIQANFSSRSRVKSKIYFIAALLAVFYNYIKIPPAGSSQSHVFLCTLSYH